MQSIRSGSGATEGAALDEAITTYDHTLRLMPCNTMLQRERLLLWAQKTDIALNQDDLSNTEDVLKKTQIVLKTQLNCTPNDGKAWLDLAVIKAHREGFTDSAMADYKMSKKVAPSESWLAEKRLLFALAFKPLLDEPALTMSQNDLAVLARAHPNRVNRIMKAAEVETPEELNALFAP